MKKSFVSILVAALWLFSTASFAGDLVYDYQFTASYETLEFTADTGSPGEPSPALKPDSIGIDFGSGGFSRTSSLAYLELAPAYSTNVTACSSEVTHKPMPRIPIGV